MNTEEQLYDVLIVELRTRKVESIAGEAMKLDSGFHNAEKREETVAQRINNNYFTSIEETGKYKVGDTLPS